MQVAAFYRGVTYVTGSIANLPVEIKDRSNNILESDRIAYLLNVSCNPEMNAHTFKLLMTASAILHGNFYAEIGDLVDDFVEAFQGKYGLLTGYKSDYSLPDNPIDYMNYLKAEVEKLRRDPAFPQDSELQNEVDNIANLINSTIYKLRFLK